MKVVFDTNIFVSALTLPGGRGDAALRRILDGRDTLTVSKPILDELLLVLARKFARDREELARVAVFLSGIAEFVEPLIRGRAIRCNARQRTTAPTLWFSSRRADSFTPTSALNREIALSAIACRVAPTAVHHA